MESTDKTYASSGVANTGLGLSIGALGLLLLQNGALGGILGGNRPDPSNPPWARDMGYERELTKANAEIGQLKAEQYANSAVLAAERRLADKIEALEKAQTATTLAQQHMNDVTAGFIAGVQEKTNLLMGMTGLVIKAPALLASEAAASAFQKSGAAPASANNNNNG